MIVEPELGEIELVDHVENLGVVDRSPFQAMPGLELLGPDATPGFGVRLDRQHVETGSGQQHGGDQSVVTGADDDYVVPSHENPCSTNPASMASRVASGRHRSICSRSSSSVGAAPATSRIPSTHTSETDLGEAA